MRSQEQLNGVQCTVQLWDSGHQVLVKLLENQVLVKLLENQVFVKLLENQVLVKLLENQVQEETPKVKTKTLIMNSKLWSRHSQDYMFSSMAS